MNERGIVLEKRDFGLLTAEYRVVMPKLKSRRAMLDRVENIDTLFSHWRDDERMMLEDLRGKEGSERLALERQYVSTKQSRLNSRRVFEESRSETMAQVDKVGQTMVETDLYLAGKKLPPFIASLWLKLMPYKDPDLVEADVRDRTLVMRLEPVLEDVASIVTV